MRSRFIHNFLLLLLQPAQDPQNTKTHFEPESSSDRDGWMKTFFIWSSEKINYLQNKFKTEWYCLSVMLK